MSLNDEVYVMSFLYEALGKYIEYCERKQRDFDQKNFVLITQKFIENLSPQEKSKGLLYNNLEEPQEVRTPVITSKLEQNSQPVLQPVTPIAQCLNPMQPVGIKSVQKQNIRNTQTQEDNNLRTNCVNEQPVQELRHSSATSQRLNSFSNLLAKRQT